jgi:hypothetical protein
LVVEIGTGSVGVEDMVVGVELYGLSEVFYGFGIVLGFEGLVSFVF